MKFYYIYLDGIPTHKYARTADGKYVVFPVDKNGKVTSQKSQVWDAEEFVKLMEVSYKTSNTVTDDGALDAVIVNKISAEKGVPSPFSDEANSVVRKNNIQNEYPLYDIEPATATRPLKGFSSKPNDIVEPVEGGYDEWKNSQLAPRQQQSVYKPFNLQDYITKSTTAPNETGSAYGDRSNEYNLPYTPDPNAPDNNDLLMPYNANTSSNNSGIPDLEPEENISLRPINKFTAKPVMSQEDKQGAYDNWKSNGTNLVDTRPVTGFNVKSTIVDPKEYETPEDNNSINDTDVVSTEDEDVEESKSTDKPEVANRELVKSTPWRDVKGSQYLQTREVPANSYRSFNFDGNEADHIAYNPLRGLSDAGRNVAQTVNNTFSSWGNKVRQSRAERQARQEQSDEKKDFMRGIAKDMVYNDGSFGKTYRPETVKEARELKREVRDVVREKERNERNAARDARKLDRIYKQTDRLMGRDYDAKQRAALEGFDKGAGLKNGQVLQDKLSENIEGFNKVYSRKQEGGYIVAKDGIHINPANNGKFTASANRAGMGVQEFASHVLANKEDYSPTQVKRANFARAASKWKHQVGGDITSPYAWNKTPIYTNQNNPFSISVPLDAPLAADKRSSVLSNTSTPDFITSFDKPILTPQENPFGLSQNPLGYKFDGNDKFSKYRLKDPSFGDPNKAFGQDMTLVNSANPFKVSSPTKFSSQYDGLATDPEPEPVVEAKKEPIIPGANYDPTRLHIYGNIMQHQANMLPVMYNTAKSLFDKPEVQNPIYNKQDVAVAQGMRRNMIAPNMNPIVDNRAAMQQAIRGNARGSGQLMNSMQANYNNAAKMMNEEQYRTKNANIAQMNNYLQKLGEIGDNRRQIDTLVDEKNRQHRLAFDKFQRDALESGEKALINKGQLHNQELADEISMQNYLNQIAKDYEYVKGPNGMPYVKFKDKKTGETKVMSAKMMKDNISRMYTDLDNNNAADAAANNAQTAETNRRIAELEAANRELQKGIPDHEVLKDHAQKNTELRNQNAALLREIEALKAAQNPSGKKKAGGFVYKRKMF